MENHKIILVRFFYFPNGLLRFFVPAFDRHTDKQTDRKTDGQTDGQAARETGIWPNMLINDYSNFMVDLFCYVFGHNRIYQVFVLTTPFIYLFIYLYNIL